MLKNFIFPEKLEKCKYNVFLKKNGKKNDGNPASYRPISLLLNLGKIYELAIANRIIAISTKNSWLSPLQFGFRSGKSAIDVIDSIVTSVEENMPKKIFTLCIFYFNIKGAFDAA